MRVSFVISTLLIVVTLSAQTALTSGASGQNQVNKTSDTNQSAKPNQEITIASPVVVKVEPTAPTHEELQKQADDRAEKVSYDGKIITFTRWQTVATCVIALFTFAQVLIYRKQAALMERGLDETRKATDAAKTSADAAEKALQMDIGMRRHHSIYVIAALFEKEVNAWAARSFQIDDAFTLWHNQSIDRLAPYVQYLERYHKETYDKILDPWRNYHGGDEHRAIYPHTYQINVNGVPRWEKFFWMNQLFKIADLLRET